MRFAADPTCQLRHPSQLYEAALEGVVLFVMLTCADLSLQGAQPSGPSDRRFPGGVWRVPRLVELVREPDLHMPEALQGYVTMGMLLCIPMIAAGRLSDLARAQERRRWARAKA
jgi:phosphatidylglycerol:prolipoprotein diacylglycerol transferase